MTNIFLERCKFQGRERIAEKSAFLDEQGFSRVLINGKVQPVRYSHQAVIFPAKQNTLQFERLGEHVDMRLEENRLRFPELLSEKDLSNL